MRFLPTGIPGAWLIEPERFTDERGSFTRTFDAERFAAHQVDPTVVQGSVSVNLRAGTLRGLHFQSEPHGEGKLVRCVRGAIFDVFADLRRESPAFGRSFATRLDPDNGLQLFIPAGCAHGFQTLEDDSEVVYLMSRPYVASAAAGVRWDDPTLAIEWPDAPPDGRIISERDRALPLIDAL